MPMSAPAGGDATGNAQRVPLAKMCEHAGSPCSYAHILQSQSAQARLRDDDCDVCRRILGLGESAALGVAADAAVEGCSADPEFVCELINAAAARRLSCGFDQGAG